MNDGRENGHDTGPTRALMAEASCRPTVVVAEHNGRIQEAAVEIVEHVPRRRNPHLHDQPRLGGIHALEHISAPMTWWLMPTTRT